MLSSSSSRTPNGSLDEAVKRELREETGIEVEVLGVVGMRTRYTEKHGAVLVIFRCALASGAPKVDDYEISAAEFFDAEQIRALESVFPLSCEMALRVLEDDSNGQTEREMPPTSSATWKAFSI